MTRVLLAAAMILFMAAPAQAGTLASEVARTGLWANTRQNTVHVWASGSQPCWSNVTDRTYGTVWRLPLPCNFAPDTYNDAEAILRDQATGTTYEMWTLKYSPITDTWSAGYITKGPDGVQGSGIRFEPGLPRLGELAAGRIPHEVQIEVPQACGTFVAPAIRTDGGAGVNCVEYGSLWKLPAGTDCSLGVPAERMLCAAARDYGLRVTDQTHDKVIVRFEQWVTSDPYYSVGGYFGCDGLQNGQPANGNEYDCWPTTGGAFWRFPWKSLVRVN